MKKILEYKIFETIDPGHSPKKMGGCLTCLGNLKRPDKDLQKRLLNKFGNKITSGDKKHITSADNTSVAAKIEPTIIDEFGVRNYYTGWYAKEESKKKFKKRKNWEKLIDFINKEVTIQFWTKERAQYLWNGEKEWIEWWKNQSNCYGWIWPYPGLFHIINLNKETLGEDTTQLKETIYHEMGHCISTFLEFVGESPIGANKDYFSVSQTPKVSRIPTNTASKNTASELSGFEDYITSEVENITRLQTIRRLFGFSPNSSCESIKQKLEIPLKSGELKFQGIKSHSFVKKGNFWFLKLIPKKVIEKKGLNLQEIQDLVVCQFRGNSNDITRFFTHISQFKDGFLWIDLEKLSSMNHSLVIHNSGDDQTERKV